MVHAGRRQRRGRSRGSTSFTLAVGEPVWSPDRTRFATLVADPSVDRPRDRAGQARHVHDGAAVHGSVRRAGRRLVDERDRRVRRSGERSGVEPGRRRAVLPRRQQQDLRRNDLSLHASPIRSSSRWSAARSRTAGCGDGRVASSRRSRTATHPTDLWLLRRQRPAHAHHRPESAARPLHASASRSCSTSTTPTASGSARCSTSRPASARTTRCRSSPGSTRS